MKFAEFFREAETQPKSIEEVAQEFYRLMSGRFQDCPLGIAGTNKENPGSGNCAWTAKHFWAWNKLMRQKFPGIYDAAQILSFPHSDKESSGHIVPVYQATILDFIKVFTGGQQHMLSKVANTTPGIHAIQEGGPEVVKNYAAYYDRYIMGDSIQAIEAFASQDAKEKVRITTYDPPRRQTPVPGRFRPGGKELQRGNWT